MNNHALTEYAMGARKGRPRKIGTRHRNGNLRPEDVRVVVLSQPHRIGLKIVQDAQGRVISDHRLDAKAESPLGRLCLSGAISEHEYEAGRRYARIVSRYRAVIASPDPTRHPEPGHGGDISPDEARRRKVAYDDAFCALGDAGQKPQRVVARVAVHEYPPTKDEVAHLKRGLFALAAFFGLTGGSKSPKRGNASSVRAPAG